MTNCIKKKLLIGWTALALAASAMAQLPPISLRPDFWTSQETLNMFLGTYGFNPDVEPKMNPADQEYLNTILTQIKTSPASAIPTLQEYTQAPTSNAVFNLLLGNLLLQSGDIAGAEKNYRTAIEKFRPFLRAYKNLALIEVQRENFSEAIPHLTQVINLGGGDSLVFGLLGYAYLTLDRPLSAEASYRQALLYEPENREWRLGLARAVLDQEKYDEAIGLVNDVLIEEPANPVLWLYQATAYLGKGDENQAAANLEIVKRLGRTDADLFLRLGRIYAQAGLGDLAAESYREALSRGDGEPINRFVRGLALLVDQRNWEDAEDFLEQLRASFQGNIDSHAESELLKLEAYIAAGQGETGRSTELLEQVVQRDPLDGRALLLLADNYSAQKNYEMAAFLYERAAKVRENQAEALVRHAKMLVQQDRYRQAAVMLERANAIEPKQELQKYLEHVRQAARAAQF